MIDSNAVIDEMETERISGLPQCRGAPQLLIQATELLARDDAAALTILIAVLMVRPQGILGIRERIG